MDYKVVVTHDDGSVEERYCATNTDIENFVVDRVRLAKNLDSKNVSINVFFRTS